MTQDPKKLVKDFLKVAKLAGIDLPADSVQLKNQAAPHERPTLPIGKMAVYVFSCGSECLKVGKAGPRSFSRYKHQHYRPGNSGSNLAKSLLACSNPPLCGLNDKNVGSRIESETGRTNFLLDAKLGVPVLNLLESFLQCKLKPKFEGFESQR